MQLKKTGRTTNENAGQGQANKSRGIQTEQNDEEIDRKKNGIAPD
jgi:hypothetical protein